MKPAKSYAALLSKALQKTGLKVAEVARRTGISRRTLEDWASGKRTPPPYTQENVLERLQNLSEEISLTNKPNPPHSALNVVQSVMSPAEAKR